MSHPPLLSKQWASRPSELSDIRKNIADVCQPLGFPQADIDQIVLAIDEACTNIMRYAYKGCREGVIKIEVTQDSQQIIFKLHDYAQQVSKDCLKKKPTALCEPGGLGVMLMRHVMDSVEFIHTKDCKGNILEMRKNRVKDTN